MLDRDVKALPTALGRKHFAALLHHNHYEARNLIFIFLKAHFSPQLKINDMANAHVLNKSFFSFSHVSLCLKTKDVRGCKEILNLPLHLIMLRNLKVICVCIA